MYLGWVGGGLGASCFLHCTLDFPESSESPHGKGSREKEDDGKGGSASEGEHLRKKVEESGRRKV